LDAGPDVTRKPTSSDVARLAGVSQSAVSRAFTPGAPVSTKTRAKVLKAAAVLNYRPNALARSLIVGRSRLIGLVVAHLDNQFYPVALEMLSTTLRARGYHILIFLATPDGEPVDGVLDTLIDYQVDGILMGSASISTRLAQRCEAAGIPVVLFNRYQDDTNLSSVVSDNRAGARAIAEHFVAGGHRRIAHIGGWQNASTGRDRALGFQEGLARHGLALADFVDTKFRPSVAKEAARAIFSRPDRPDAVSCGNDPLAFAVMDVLRFELGLRVPEDVAVAGYDDVPMASWPAYDLTTARQHADHLVEQTVDILIARIEGGDAEPRRVVLDSPLVVRGTTRPVAADPTAHAAGRSAGARMRLGWRRWRRTRS
jgi:DNA-binding LacI/PurR family transcriptional regulator